MAQAAIELGVRDLETPFTSTWSDGWRRFRRSPSALIGLGIIFLLAVCATLSPQISGHTDPLAQNLTQPTMAPSWLVKKAAMACSASAFLSDQRCSSCR